ncbi:MAG: PqqD family protein [Candidatus Eisenbacteria sp.]|nr:PqqD family protein [Candidatus Eisenbacteria bacterium]
MTNRMGDRTGAEQPGHGAKPSGHGAEREYRYSRSRTARAFEDKQGGWTLATVEGEYFQLRNAASVHVWEALDGMGATLPEIVRLMSELFPLAALGDLKRDALAFLGQLQDLGFVDVESTNSVAIRSGAALRGNARLN